MADVVRRGNINIIRPLLSFSPEELQDYLKKLNIGWIYDNSNECDGFLRVRIRKALPFLDKELGISVKRLAETARALGSVREYFEQQVDQFLNSQVKFWADCGLSFFPQAFNSLHNELKIRLLSAMIKKIGGRYYPPTYEKLLRLSEAISDKNFRGRTLGNCEIQKFQNKIWVIKEVVGHTSVLKKQWDDYVNDNPRYKDIKIPYKLKIDLVKFAKR
jgi:tRNA(Ile)-lysidine synthase